MDGKDEDDTAIHLLGYWKEEPVATVRLLLVPKKNNSTEAILGRIVVLCHGRNKGWGSQIVQKLESIALCKGVHRISLTPHHHLQHFYQRLGFQRVEHDTLVWVNEHCQLMTI